MSIAQWQEAGHLREGEGIREGRIVLPDAAEILLGRLDSGQAGANGEATVLALAGIAEEYQGRSGSNPADAAKAMRGREAGCTAEDAGQGGLQARQADGGGGGDTSAAAPSPSPAADDGEPDGMAARLKALGEEERREKLRLQRGRANREELKLAADAGALLSRTDAEAALAQLLEGELTAWRQFLDDAAEKVAGEHGLDVQALRLRLREMLRGHRSARQSALEKVAAALARVTQDAPPGDDPPALFEGEPEMDEEVEADA